ncbi:MAG: MotA/TolQ/ExbB proton channel family protein [Hydrogenothermaceae bacterium]|nr:MotA/TolQ/ExbB proton channel family protein [Hydrogenothermaceae bacterium]
MRKFIAIMLILGSFSLSFGEEDKLMKAYKKEYIYLINQKKALMQELEALEQQLKSISEQGNKEVVEAENKIMLLKAQGDDLENKIREIEIQLSKAEESKNLLPVTVQQAVDTLSMNGYKNIEDVDPIKTMKNAFLNAFDLLDKNSSLRIEKGEFFLQDGKKVSGEVIKIGGVARYGITPDGNIGVLLPIGDGLFGLWNPKNSSVVYDTVKGLKEGNLPPTIGIFLYDNESNPVNPPAERTFFDHIESGGIIGYIIILLGFIALILIVSRIFIIFAASRKSSEVTENIANMLKSGKIKEALEYAEGLKGVVPSVLAYVLRNLNSKDKETIDYVITEAMLRYTSSLDRFKTTIIVIAAVSPLLGLLGTVTGIIETFNVITEFGTGDPKLMAGGISEALVTTELGLVVAIPTYILGSLITGWSERIKEFIEESALKILNHCNV